jgi:hypothetical protein
MPKANPITTLKQVLQLLEGLADGDRQKVLGTAMAFFGETNGRSYQPSASSKPQVPLAFSVDTAVSPKEFLLDKKPRTDIERVACLAFYLAHYREIQQFKTADITQLNAEAAQPRFANPAQAVKNAMRGGLIVPGNRGMRQLSAPGERFVMALPDREAATGAMQDLRRKPRKKTARR